MAHLTASHYGLEPVDRFDRIDTPAHRWLAGVAKLADAQDLKSWVAKAACGFDSRPRHFLVCESFLHSRYDSPTSLSTSPHLWNRAHQRASFQAVLRFKRSAGSCAMSARTVSSRQPPNIGRSGPLSVPAETARDNGGAPLSSPPVGALLAR